MIEDFKKFEKELNSKKPANIENYEKPQYLVQPTENDKGYFMFKTAFDKMKIKFTPKISYSE